MDVLRALKLEEGQRVNVYHKGAHETIAETGKVEQG